MPGFDEEQHAVTACPRVGGDENAVQHGGVEGGRSGSRAEVHGRASAPAVPDDDRRGDLGSKFSHAGEVLREQRQDDGLFLG
ncbi:hypothetical protein GCM10010466_37490 [Planomonospora alba]|uniref:Uncharacterized protein n=1 Tax=Planomonospora alba TaxID=161354 RepID=A0ABP6NBS6_9ACTN